MPGLFDSYIGKQAREEKNAEKKLKGEIKKGCVININVWYYNTTKLYNCYKQFN